MGFNYFFSASLLEMSHCPITPKRGADRTNLYFLMGGGGCKVEGNFLNVKKYIYLCFFKDNDS